MRATFESWLHRQWTKRGLLAWALSPLSVVFLCIARNRRMKTKPHRLPVPVVVVGNIYVGGTGKTPVTIALVKELVKRGYHPGVVSRGFGRKEDAPQMVLPDSPAVNVGDEPLLIARQTQVPVAVARDRVAAALLLLDNWRAMSNSRWSVPEVWEMAGCCPQVPCANPRPVWMRLTPLF